MKPGFKGDDDRSAFLLWCIHFNQTPWNKARASISIFI